MTKLKNIIGLVLLIQFIGILPFSQAQAAKSALDLVFVYLNGTPNVIKKRTGLTLTAATREALAKLKRTLRNSDIRVSARSARIVKRKMNLAGKTPSALLNELQKKGTFQKLRKNSRAELITVIIPDNMQDNVCGIAYTPPDSYLTTAVLKPKSMPNWFGLSLVNVNCLLNNQTFAHEIGHNLGAGHDKFATNFNPFVRYGTGKIIPAFKGNKLYCFKTALSYRSYYSNFLSSGKACKFDVFMEAYSHPGKTLKSIPRVNLSGFTQIQKNAKIGGAKMNNASVTRKIGVKVAKMY